MRLVKSYRSYVLGAVMAVVPYWRGTGYVKNLHPRVNTYAVTTRARRYAIPLSIWGRKPIGR